MLLRGVARTAVVAGTATAVSNRVSRRQAERWAQQDAAPGGYQEAPPPQQAPAASATGTADELSKLAALRDQGVLSPEEFEAQKAKLLAS
jgi:hypothetical protein